MLPLLILLSQAGPDPSQVSPERLRVTLEALCAQPRLAGSPESMAAADYAAGVLAGAGFEVERPRYTVFLPRQTRASLAVVSADGSLSYLPLEEQALPEDPWSQRRHEPPMHGLTAAGVARGRVVFAGLGTPGEFAAIPADQRRGAIALVRYGGLFRGLKVQNAAAAGCAAALLYCDPEDDGSQRGPVLPVERWRPPFGIQRGSVYNDNGDPLTPGYAASAEAPRRPRAEAPGLVSIPSLPVSWSTAARLFGAGGRPPAPQALETTVEIVVEQDERLVTIENTIAFLAGGRRAEEWLILGGHRDAWGFGAADNGSGCTVLLETARLLGAAHAGGWLPDRSLVIALWDAEEWGLVGSTEWVEDHRQTLLARGFAYVNLDSIASGWSFGASCTPGLVAALREVCAEEGIHPPAELGVPGGGSDHVPFLEIAGLEVLGFGFGGGNGVYHSALDTPWVVERFLDPGFAIHAQAVRLTVQLAVRLSHADARLDGVAAWCAQAAQAAGALELPEPERRALLDAVDALRAAAERAPLNQPERFLRQFVPAAAGAENVLWRSRGYGSDWFPEIQEALVDAGSVRPAMDRTTAVLAAAARALQPPPSPASE